MAFEIKTKVLYLKDEDLKPESRIKNMENIDLTDVENKELVVRTGVAIFVRNKERKILKSRY